MRNNPSIPSDPSDDDTDRYIITRLRHRSLNPVPSAPACHSGTNSPTGLPAGPSRPGDVLLPHTPTLPVRLGFAGYTSAGYTPHPPPREAQPPSLPATRSPASSPPTRTHFFTDSLLEWNKALDEAMDAELELTPTRPGAPNTTTTTTTTTTTSTTPEEERTDPMDSSTISATMSATTGTATTVSTGGTTNAPGTITPRVSLGTTTSHLGPDATTTNNTTRSTARNGRRGPPVVTPADIITAAITHIQASFRAVGWEIVPLEPVTNNEEHDEHHDELLPVHRTHTIGDGYMLPPSPSPPPPPPPRRRRNMSHHSTNITRPTPPGAGAGAGAGAGTGDHRRVLRSQAQASRPSRPGHPLTSVTSTAVATAVTWRLQLPRWALESLPSPDVRGARPGNTVIGIGVATTDGVAPTDGVTPTGVNTRASRNPHPHVIRAPPRIVTDADAEAALVMFERGGGLHAALGGLVRGGKAIWRTVGVRWGKGWEATMRRKVRWDAVKQVVKGERERLRQELIATKRRIEIHERIHYG